MFEKLLFILACLILPIIWGVLTNWLFDLWRKRAPSNGGDDDSIFPDYQI